MSRTSPKNVTLSVGVTLCLLGACGEPPATPTADPPPADGQGEVLLPQEAPVDPANQDRGAEVYATYCAMCHGADGDGQGTVVLDRPARSFRDGGFSFGNTPAALFRTVSNGIGGTPMPGFSDSLSEADRHAVVAHVQTFLPEQVVVAPGSTVLEVTDRPRVARGSFPPVADGLAMLPRGLLVGGVDGMSFQYDASDLRLLAVRQGGFVDRKDWENRGGDALYPLGQPVFLVDAGAPEAMWQRTSTTGVIQPLEARLLATEVAGGKAWVEYALLADGERVALVRESGQALSRGGWTGFRRSFEVHPEPGIDGGLQLAHGRLAGSVIFPDLEGRTIRQQDPDHGTLIRHRREFALADGYHLNEDLLFGLAGDEAQMEALKEALR